MSLGIEAKYKRIEREDELLTFFVDSSADWGNMSDSEFEEFRQRIQELISDYIMEKGDAE